MQERNFTGTLFWVLNVSVAEDATGGSGYIEILAQLMTAMQNSAKGKAVGPRRSRMLPCTGFCVPMELMRNITAMWGVSCAERVGPMGSSHPQQEAVHVHHCRTTADLFTMQNKQGFFSIALRGLHLSLLTGHSLSSKQAASWLRRTGWHTVCGLTVASGMFWSLPLPACPPPRSVFYCVFGGQFFPIILIRPCRFDVAILERESFVSCHYLSARMPDLIKLTP